MIPRLVHVPLVLLFGCAQTPAQTPVQTSPTEASSAEPRLLHVVMQEHFVHVDDLQKAVIAGDLGQAKLSAQWIMDNHVDQLNESWVPHIERLEAAAVHVTAAPDLAQASLGAARVAGACGSCHEGHGIELDLTAPPIEEGKGTKAHMKRHQWATDRLWDAVVGNSDEVWKQGAAALSDSPLRIHDDSTAADDVINVLTRAAEVVHEIGHKSKTLELSKDRIEALGELLSTCAACHGELGIEPQSR